MRKLSAALRRLWSMWAGAPGALPPGLRREEGASLVEYALLVALLALACIAAIEALSGGISGAFNNMKAILDNKA
jgi:Flp pilus assembly pilin Flp